MRALSRPEHFGEVGHCVMSTSKFSLLLVTNSDEDSALYRFVRRYFSERVATCRQ